MYRRLAKASVIIALAVVLVLCTTITASAKTVSEYSVTKIYNSYGNVSYYTSLFTLHDPYTEASYICDFINYTPNASYNAYHIDFDFPNIFSKGEIITISGAVALSQYTSSFTLNFGSFKSVELFNLGSVKMYSELSSGFYYYIPFSVSFEFSEASLKYIDKVFFTYVGNNNLHSFGINGIEYSSSVNVGSLIDGSTDKIIENDKAMQEQEKQEISGSGNDSVDKITGMIPDVGTDGIKQSFEKLTSGMSYSGTDCVWTFPAIKIPAIGAVVPEMTLSEEKPINLSEWVRALPEAVLKTVQAVCSVAIVLFVVYEMMDFIIFCFTLKKNGSGKGKEDDD